MLDWQCSRLPKSFITVLLIKSYVNGVQAAEWRAGLVVPVEPLSKLVVIVVAELAVFFR